MRTAEIIGIKGTGNGDCMGIDCGSFSGLGIGQAEDKVVELVEGFKATSIIDDDPALLYNAILAFGVSTERELVEKLRDLGFTIEEMWKALIRVGYKEKTIHEVFQNVGLPFTVQYYDPVGYLERRFREQRINSPNVGKLREWFKDLADQGINYWDAWQKWAEGQGFLVDAEQDQYVTALMETGFAWNTIKSTMDETVLSVVPTAFIPTEETPLTLPAITTAVSKTGIPTWIWLVGGLVVVFFIFKNKKK